MKYLYLAMVSIGFLALIVSLFSTSRIIEEDKVMKEKKALSMISVPQTRPATSASFPVRVHRISL